VNKGKSSAILRALSTQTGAFDVRSMQAGVAKFQKGVARALRRGKALPAKFLDDIQPTAPLEEQVAEIWRRYATWAHLRHPSKDARKDLEYVLRILRLYDRLREAGCKLTTALSLREKHAKILLDWLKQHHKPATIRSTWSILRTWCLAMGKQGMVKELNHYWPDAPKANKPSTSNARQRSDNPVLQQRVLQELQLAADPTHWLVERLCGALGITVGQALQLDAASTAHYTQGFVQAKRPNENTIAVIRVDSDEKRKLIEEVIALLAERRRKCLCWADLSIADGIRKHQQRITYVRSKCDPATLTAPRASSASTKPTST
jgi:hypothetical protein